MRYKKGIINDAKQDFESAITKKEKFAEAFNNLGILLFSEEIYDDAEKNFNSYMDDNIPNISSSYPLANDENGEISNTLNNLMNKI